MLRPGHRQPGACTMMSLCTATLLLSLLLLLAFVLDPTVRPGAAVSVPFERCQSSQRWAVRAQRRATACIILAQKGNALTEPSSMLGCPQNVIWAFLFTQTTQLKLGGVAALDKPKHSQRRVQSPFTPQFSFWHVSPLELRAPGHCEPAVTHLAAVLGLQSGNFRTSRPPQKPSSPGQHTADAFGSSAMARVMQHTQLPRWQVLLLVALALAAVLAAPRICHLTCGQAHSAGGSSGSGSSEAGGSASSAPPACGSGQPRHRPFAFVTLLASHGQDSSQQGLEADGYFQSVRLLNYRLTRNPATRTRLPGAQFVVLVAPQVGGRAGVWGGVRWVVVVGGGDMRVALKYEGCADAPAKQRAPHARCSVPLSSCLCSAAAPCSSCSKHSCLVPVCCTSAAGARAEKGHPPAGGCAGT